MEKVECFETKDGKIYNSKEEAERHECLLILKEKYEECKLYGNVSGCRIEFEDLIEWIENNTKFIKEIIKQI